MKKFLLLAVALIGLTAESSFAQIPQEMIIDPMNTQSSDGSDLIQVLDQWNYQPSLLASPLSVVVYHLQNNVPDHNGQLVTNMKEVADFYSSYPYLHFFRVEGFTSPALMKQLGIKKYPTIAIYHYGQLVQTIEDVFMTQNLFPLVQEAVENF